MLDRDAPVALITHTYVHNSNYWFVITEDAEKRRFHETWSRFDQVAETRPPTTCQYCVGESTPTTIIDTNFYSKGIIPLMFVHNLAVMLINISIFT